MNDIDLLLLALESPISVNFGANNLYDAVKQEATRQRKEAASVIRELRDDAERWRWYASSPQTALMLGTKLDPFDYGVNWIAECNALADAAIKQQEASEAAARG